MQKRQYQKANDSYLRLSIGNAPWPIGVTMVGYVHAPFPTARAYMSRAGFTSGLLEKRSPQTKLPTS